MNTDLVELVNDDGSPCGTAPRSTVHGVATPLHRAFSCHLEDQDGRMLMTRRALTKRTWPGVWTNSFCGHPRPGETTIAAIHRYSRHELGVDVADLTPLLPDFRYRAVDAGGIVENELCPVFRARAIGSLHVNSLEVAEFTWAPVEAITTSVRATPWAFSPWFVAQMQQIQSTTLPNKPTQCGFTTPPRVTKVPHEEPQEPQPTSTLESQSLTTRRRRRSRPDEASRAILVHVECQVTGCTQSPQTAVSLTAAGGTNGAGTPNEAWVCPAHAAALDAGRHWKSHPSDTGWILVIDDQDMQA